MRLARARTRASFRSRFSTRSRLSSGWKPMHQQPPKTPLFASTSRANASQLDSSSTLIVYPAPTTDAA